jgi:Tfp pilus assembly protein PilF
MYRCILAREPRNANAHHLLGMLLWQRGDAESAAEAIRKAIRIAPAVAQFHNNLGLVLDAAGRRGEAGGCFRTAVELAPGYAEAHANLGRALERERRYKDRFRRSGKLCGSNPIFPKRATGSAARCRVRATSPGRCAHSKMSLHATPITSKPASTWGAR